MKLQDVQETIIEMRNDGYGYKRIAQVLNANPASVKRWIAKLGLPTKLDTNNPEKPRLIQCAECGESVKTVRFNTEYCSNACRMRARKIKANGRKKCVRCAAFIYGPQNVRYCSEECGYKHTLSIKTIKLNRILCAQCGDTKLARRKSNVCSDKCRRAKAKVRERMRERVRVIERPKYNIKCRECGKFFETTKRKISKYCGVACSNKYKNRRNEVARRERLLANGKVEWSISIERLTKRDGKRCYLCGDLMNYQEDYNHGDYPSIEHIKPVSKGGTHTWDNVKLAHRKCNIEKSNSWIE